MALITNQSLLKEYNIVSGTLAIKNQISLAAETPTI